MSWLSHGIFLLFGLALALAASALLMLAFGVLWPGSDPTVIVLGALVVALLLPVLIALAARKWVAGGQPLTPWLASYATSIVIALGASLAL